MTIYLCRFLSQLSFIIITKDVHKVMLITLIKEDILKTSIYLNLHSGIDVNNKVATIYAL